MNRTRKIGAFFSVAVLAGIWKKIADRWTRTKGWKRWALLAAGGAATGLLGAIVLRAFL